jgi:hypothetical protein
LKIILDLGKAATLHPSSVGRDCDTVPPTILTPPVEDDGDLRAVSERLLECVVQLALASCHD